jgi:hypothetical protein
MFSNDFVFNNIPPLNCMACGSTWFRELSFTEFKSKQFWPRSPEPLVDIPMTILVCLCGRPFPLLPQGVRGPTMTDAIRRFRAGLEHAQKCGKDYAVIPAVLPTGVDRAPLAVFYERVHKVEDEVGRRLAKQGVAAGQRQACGRFWRSSRGQPARHNQSSTTSEAAKGRDWLTAQLQILGLTFRKARAIVTAVLEAISEGLQRDGWVETPLGEFYLVRRTAPYQRKRWGRNQNLHRWSNRVVFKPDACFVRKGGK